MPEVTFTTAELYGGAITCELPKGLVSAATFRQIPDQQEVFLYGDSTSVNPSDALIFDLLELVDVPDEKALEYHMQEICKLNDTKWYDLKTLDGADYKAPHFPGFPCSYIVTSQDAMKWGKKKTPLVLVVALLRLKEVKTDLLITYNVPFENPEQQSALKEVLDGADVVNVASARIELAKSTTLHILDTLEVKNWKLFG